MVLPRSWDVFCRVVDNYGDAAVCWRLARALATRTQGRVRLWIDALEPLHAMAPEVVAGVAVQEVSGVEVRSRDTAEAFVAPADVAVDAFGGGIPDDYARAMARQSGPRPIWVVLEYLSAESWVSAHHGLPSPHPRLPIPRYFFFPGVQPGTGGLLREPDLDRRRAQFLQDPARRSAFWRAAGFEPPASDSRVVSLFGYENPAAAELLDTWSAAREPVVAAVPESRLSPQVAAHMGLHAADGRAGRSVRRGSLEVRFLPFLRQDGYDELLWSCAWNFVRGEDSFVRAQWAERPLVWQIYPQAGSAHLGKLEAFLSAYTAGLAPALAAPLARLWRGWNEPARGVAAVRPAWAALDARGDDLARHARQWAQRVQEVGELAAKLADFCAERLK